MGVIKLEHLSLKLVAFSLVFSIEVAHLRRWNWILWLSDHDIGSLDFLSGNLSDLRAESIVEWRSDVLWVVSNEDDSVSSLVGEFCLNEEGNVFHDVDDNGNSWTVVRGCVCAHELEIELSTNNVSSGWFKA